MNYSAKANLKDEIVSRLNDSIASMDTSWLSKQKGQSQKSQIIRFDFPIDNINILSWLDGQKNSVKIYWSDRLNESEVGGVGVADSVKGNSEVSYKEFLAPIREIVHLGNTKPRYYGGILFSNISIPDGSWKSFDSNQFFLPQFEIGKDQNEGTTFTCNLVWRPGTEIENLINSVRAELERLVFTSPNDLSDLPKLLSRENIPDFPKWESIVKDVLKSISAGDLKKLVLARKAVLKFREAINPFSILNRLKHSSPGCYRFCFQKDDGLAFVGASPERLYKREKNTIFMEALAGTRGRGNSEEEDNCLGQELKSSKKDLREHHFVVENLREVLTQLGCTFDINGDVSLLKLNSLQHLLLSIQGSLPQNVTDAEILNQLHPTSAVGGYPTDKVLKCIQAHEPFSRGWYAGPIGWIGHESTELAVAIRSGLIDGNQMEVYTGAGIVHGSKPNEEWEEMENKFDSFIGKIIHS